MKLILRKVDKDNYNEVLSLRVTKEQEEFIETIEECLQESEEVEIYRPVGIYDENKLIGFAMYGFFSDESKDGRVWLDRFMIDQKYQGMGYAKLSLRILINKLYEEYNYDEIILSVYEKNINAIKVYEKLGFKFNGEADTKGEKIMILKYSENGI